MKRLIICCDGTWNKASAKHPTNVNLTAQLIAPYDENGVPQVVFYDQGVGTSHLINEAIETRLAGAFGWGLFDNVADAYRFIVLNYEPGDEIFIFGFSRGAFTARSLAGMLRKCGVVPKSQIKKLDRVFEFYKDAATHPDSDQAQKFRMEHSPQIVLKDRDREWRLLHGVSHDETNQLPILCVKYIGVWDTVGALGVPQHLLISRLAGTKKKYAFHDQKLSSTVKSARHAVAVDEDRLSFAPSLWDNLDDLNGRFDGTPYQQLWFPGDHGSVGGGGDVVGLSHDALLWVLEGAIEQGLAVDKFRMDALREDINPTAALKNVSKPGGLIERIYRRGARVGPQRASELANSTLDRLEFETKEKNFEPYRPRTLHSIHQGKQKFSRPLDLKRPEYAVSDESKDVEGGEENIAQSQS